jgi:hypothetical protein
MIKMKNTGNIEDNFWNLFEKFIFFAYFFNYQVIGSYNFIFYKIGTKFYFFYFLVFFCGEKDEVARFRFRERKLLFRSY